MIQENAAGALQTPPAADTVTYQDASVDADGDARKPAEALEEARALTCTPTGEVA